MTNVATRLLSLILLLQKRPHWKASELAAELNVSERTVLRYMDMLDELGIPIYSERGPYGGFSLVRGYKLPPLIFSPEEATVLYMGAHLVRDVWGQTYGDAVTSVTAKLDNVLADDLRQEVSQSLQSLVILAGLTRRDYRPWEGTLHTLRRCIGERHCVHLQYRGMTRQEDTARVVEPYGLTLLWGLWYLVGYCRLRQEVRTFRVDRIREVTPLEEHFTVPRDFSLRQYLERTMSSLVAPAYGVAVLLAPGVTQAVRERHDSWMSFAEQGDGSLVARFRVADMEWATGWVLSLGPAARVLEPPELIARVCATARAALQMYDPGPAQHP